jgi:hypothetical protein
MGLPRHIDIQHIGTLANGHPESPFRRYVVYLSFCGSNQHPNVNIERHN